MGQAKQVERRKPTPFAVVIVAAVIVLAAIVALAAAFPSGAADTGAARSGTALQDTLRIARLQTEAERLRRLPLGHAVSVEHVDREGITALVASLSSEGSDPELVHATDQALHLMGQLSAGQHLDQLLGAGLAAQVAGLYDPATKQLYVVDVDQAQASDSTLLHEIVHALQDARYDLHGRSFRQRAADADGQAAAQALVEGDATEVQSRYIRSAGLGAALSELGTSLTQLSQVPSDQRLLPRYLQRSLEFSYLRGAAFVARLRSVGGEEAVDRAFRDPPRTTLAIIRPARYLRGDPPGRRVRLPRAGGAIARVLETTFGASDLLALGIGEDVSASWRGGRIALDRSGSSGVVTIVVATTRAAELARGLRSALPANARIGRRGAIVTVRIAGRLPRA